MKANRKFVEEREAVSAVIGVILMVAITVAIAGTVYMYVSGMLGGPSTVTPSVGVTYNKIDKIFTLGAPSENDIAWTDTACKLVNGTTVSWPSATAGGTYLAAGDTIDCSTYVSAGNTYTFTLLYNTTGGSMYSYTWTQT